MAAPAVTLADMKTNITDSEYRKIHVAGEFLHDNELYLAARSLESVQGYHVITPFQTNDGPIIMFDRGFVALEKKLPATRLQGQVEGQVALEGFVRFPRPKAWVQPENEPEKNVWFYIDPSAMGKAMSLNDVEGKFYLEAGSGLNPGDWPKGGQIRVDLPNDHLQYAITWALLALALAVIYVLYHLKREGKIK